MQIERLVDALFTTATRLAGLPPEPGTVERADAARARRATVAGERDHLAGRGPTGRRSAQGFPVRDDRAA
ncbi:hypothetical protein ACQP2F_17465 [Actinoplanes sp. CA-030573]|uniref:hypothetical protein n=1 Tax=Actinoplanes sp. CA-030573 TaxID=3239898 RepID=UPI003D90F1B1